MTKRQLQAKFKHAADFGVQGNWSNAAGNKFNSVINQHINSKGVKDINGTHRGNNVMHYVNPKTRLNVISTPSGNVISGWKLNSSQLKMLLIVEVYEN
ncbi:colicin D domain-containing protein [Bergeyella zoohelcum]|uniref:colicin D domain-containing protein n=1 Tax=Bergeyella zoohelcum TaxID=1015 RepID=UPI0009DB5925